MRKKSFTADKLIAKRVYHSPTINVVKLGTATILTGSDKPTTTNEEYLDGGNLDGNF